MLDVLEKVEPTNPSAEVATSHDPSDTAIRDTPGAGRADTVPATADAALLLDMKEPAVVETSQPDHESEGEQQDAPRETRSILNAASDSSDGEETVDASRDDDDAKPVDEDTNGDDEEDEDLVPPRHGEKGVQYSLTDLFINPNLKCKSANAVLKKDPFAIPRADDNVTEYRPRFNPLSILVSEEKLLPRDFTFDFSEGIPGEPKLPGKSTTLGKRGKSDQGRTSRSNSDFDSSSLLVRKTHVPPIRNPQVFGDKLATMGLLMGSMPRQPQATPTPLINTPTVHNPFGEPLMELVVSNDPQPQASEFVALQRLRSADTELPPHPYDQELPISTASQPAETLTAEFDGITDLHNLSNLSKLSIAADNVAAADSNGAFHTGYAPPTLPPATPPTTALYDGLASYLPSHFAEKRVPHMIMDPALYEVAPYHNEQFADNSYFHHAEYVNAPQSYASTPAHSEHESQHIRDHHTTDAAPAQSQSLQPIAKKPRSKNVFRPCTHPGCTKGARGKSGLCQKHGGGKRCATPNCPKGAQGSSKYCLFHGGGYRCTVPGCPTGARGTSGLCAKHGGYKRAREGGVGGEDGSEDLQGEGGPSEKKPRMEAYEGRALEATG